MTEKDVCRMVKSAGFPTAYHHFEEGQEPGKPYLVYLYPETNNFSADGLFTKASINWTWNCIRI